MEVEDLSQNIKVKNLQALTQALGKSKTPDQTIRALQQGFTQTNGFVASLLLLTRGLPQGHYRVVQMRLNDGPPDGNPFGPSSSKPDSPRAGGILAEITAHPEPQLIQSVDWSSDPFFHDRLRGYNSLIAIPFGGDHLPMNWLILLKRPPDRLTVADLEEAVQRVALSGSLLQNQVLAGQLALANERIDRDARQVGELQRALLPADLPTNAGLEMAASYDPSGRAGGDLYDFFPLDEHYADQPVSSDRPTRWCIFVGDAAGHGLAAAVVMAIVQAVLHAHPAGIATPVTLLEHANRQLCRKSIGGFVTAFLGIYEPALRRLTYANAGHPRPLLRRGSDGAVAPLDAVGTYPLGIEASNGFTEATLLLDRGDTLLLFTDGITEARNKQHEQFGIERLTGSFRDGGDEPAALIRNLRETLRVYEQGQPPEDDQTLVAARVL